ncbi:MAG: ribosome maturation factor RimP [Gammaproteobacteria bacterium]|nr:ribosome maturation factor RimP [Gammaproteobacteria bacterium]
MTTVESLQRILQPGAEALGFELVAVELHGRGRNTLLRVYIDGPQGITVDDCAHVSGQLSAILDVEDPIPGHYTLEVSSPGLDRPLVALDHFKQVVGHRIKVQMRQCLLGRRKFIGTLVRVSGKTLVVEVDGENYELPCSGIEKARLVPQL